MMPCLNSFIHPVFRRYFIAYSQVAFGPVLQPHQHLAKTQTAGVRPRYLLLDRGFCSVDVIRYLQKARYAWLMPLVLRGRKADHPKGPSGSRVFAGRKRSGWAVYTMTNAAKRTARFRVCIKCRNRRGERGLAVVGDEGEVDGQGLAASAQGMRQVALQGAVEAAL